MISNEKWAALKLKLEAAGLHEEDFQEHFIRSSGNGGQNINKVNTCVFLRHEPTKLEVKCQKTRSQSDNRYFARWLLLEKFKEKILKTENQAARERYRKRKQKQRRSRKAKQKILEEKHKRSEIKNSRRNPSFSLPGDES